MIKAVFIDIDETLTNSNREVTEETKEAISNCIKKNIKIILTSGRSRNEAISYGRKIGTSPYIISSNGASCYDIEKNKEIYNESIDKKTILKLLKYADENVYTIKLNYKHKLVLNIAAYPDEKVNELLISELVEIIENEEIVQCVMSNKDLRKMQDFKKYLEKNFKDVKIINESKRLKNSNLEPSKNYYCDITSKNVSKGSAVKKMCNYLGIKAEEIIAIGDGENDISMFEITPNSVAMGNAVVIAKKIANYETDTNDENGVAKVLNKL